VLVADGLVARADADALLAAQRRKAGEAHPLVVIAGQKWPSLKPPHRLLGLEELTEWLAGRVELDYLRIDPLKIDFAAVTGVMSSAYATRFGVLPIQVGLREVVVATTQPFLREWEKEVAGILKKEIRRVVASPADVARYLVEFYNLARSVKKAAQTSGAHGIGATSFEQLVELGQGNRQFDANDRHIVNIVDWLWQYAFEQRASDIHIEPRRDMGLVRFRIDGVLHQVPDADERAHGDDQPHQDPRPDGRGREAPPQDGRIKTRVASGKEVELRLSTLPTAFGEKLVMRIFDPEVLVRNMAELGFSEQDEARWHSIAGQPNGIILVTGPTGSGKTTTLYSTSSSSPPPR
jgi:general secretion pathway protein E